MLDAQLNKKLKIHMWQWVWKFHKNNIMLLNLKTQPQP